MLNELWEGILEEIQNGILYAIVCILGGTTENISGQTPKTVLEVLWKEVLEKLCSFL